MKTTLLALFAVCLLVPGVLLAQEESLQFEQANTFYRNGDYRKAAEMYEQVSRNGYESPALYYNLGNAYFKLQNISSAVLSYERARRLAPRDEDILYNLRLANLRVVDKIDPVPQLFLIDWWNAIITQFSAAGWALLGILGLWVAAAAATLFLLARQTVVQRVAFLLASLAVLVSIGAFVGMAQAERSVTAGIVFTQSIAVKSAPDAQSTELFVLHEGVKVEVLDEVGEWRKIRLADGKVGWLTAGSLQII
jgi:tetratricopeptide (TPR) repeat protein